MGFSGRFPRWLTGIIGVVQLLLTLAIIGLEIGSLYIDLAHGTIFVGIWAGIVFLIATLSMLFITCCCRGRCCASYVLVMNVFSLALACVVIYFDQLFIGNLCKCYFEDKVCCALRGIPSFQANYTAVLEDCGQAIYNGNISSRVCPAIPYEKLPLVKAQLACAVGMLVSCLVYIASFLFACFGVCFGDD